MPSRCLAAICLAVLASVAAVGCGGNNTTTSATEAQTAATETTTDALAHPEISDEDNALSRRCFLVKLAEEYTNQQGMTDENMCADPSNPTRVSENRLLIACYFFASNPTQISSFPLLVDVCDEALAPYNMSSP